MSERLSEWAERCRDGQHPSAAERHVLALLHDLDDCEECADAAEALCAIATAPQPPEPEPVCAGGAETHRLWCPECLTWGTAPPGDVTCGNCGHPECSRWVRTAPQPPEPEPVCSSAEVVEAVREWQRWDEQRRADHSTSIPTMSLVKAAHRMERAIRTATLRTLGEQRRVTRRDVAALEDTLGHINEACLDRDCEQLRKLTEERDKWRALHASNAHDTDGPGGLIDQLTEALESGAKAWRLAALHARLAVNKGKPMKQGRICVNQETGKCEISEQGNAYVPADDLMKPPECVEQWRQVPAEERDEYYEAISAGLDTVELPSHDVCDVLEHVATKRKMHSVWGAQPVPPLVPRREVPEAEHDWAMLVSRTTKSGKTLFHCMKCHRESIGPDKGLCEPSKTTTEG